MRYLGALSLAIVVLDQWTKRLVEARLPLYDDRPVIEGLLSLQHVRNTGAVFGILQNADIPAKPVVFAALAFLALVGLVYYARTIPRAEVLSRLALALVIGGAIGNLIDRVRYGYVVDFVKMYWGSWVWPNYNVADAAISTGLVLLIADSFRHRERAGEPAAPAAA